MAEFRVRRDDLSVCEMVDGEPLRPDLEQGEAQLLIERFTLTANNVTYAALGDELGYRRIFPAPEGWGSCRRGVMPAPSRPGRPR